ncbi:MAG: hypothetical protein WBG92_02420 [Thiohalocapsa sp.]
MGIEARTRIHLSHPRAIRSVFEWAAAAARFMGVYMSWAALAPASRSTLVAILTTGVRSMEGLLTAAGKTSCHVQIESNRKQGEKMCGTSRCQVDARRCTSIFRAVLGS